MSRQQSKQQVLGTINRRIDVGFDYVTDHTFIIASSNLIRFTYDELKAIRMVLDLIHDNFSASHGKMLSILSRHDIPGWIPATPPAEEIIL